MSKRTTSQRSQLVAVGEGNDKIEEDIDSVGRSNKKSRIVGEKKTPTK